MIQKRIAKCGLSMQSVKGTPESVAQYAYGVTEGSLFKMEITENPLASTWSNRSEMGFDRSLIKPVQSVGLIATPKVIGLLLLGVLGTDVVTGSGAPYTHEMTSAQDLPYLTSFMQFGTADWGRIADCKVSSLEFAWENAGHAKCKTDIMGITPDMLAAAYTETSAEFPQAGFFAGGGGTFEVEGVAAKIISGSVKFDNKVEQPGLAATTLPADVIPAAFTVTWSLKVLPDDTAFFREVVFGSGAAGALSGVSPSPHRGDIEVRFKDSQNAAHTLDIYCAGAKFACEFPEASPAGGPAEITLAAMGQLGPAGEADVTVTLINGVASY